MTTAIEATTASLPELAFPALTPAQRLHFEVFGYVIVEGTHTPAMCEELLGLLRGMRDEFEAGREIPGVDAGPSPTFDGMVAGFGAGRLCGYHRAFDASVANPKLLAVAQELLGGPPRPYPHVSAMLNCRNPDPPSGDPPPYPLHRNEIDMPRIVNDLWHTTNLQAMTTLQDLGPDDGGTVFVPGTHKVCPPGAKAAAFADPSLIHKFVGPAGSTLFFADSLMHGTGCVRSERGRAVILASYTLPMFRIRFNRDFVADDVLRASEPLRSLLVAEDGWTGYRPRYRTLEMPAATGVDGA